MHVVFIPYGKKEWVDMQLRDMAAQKYPITLTSPDGKETKQIMMEGQVRVLPFGFYEHVFPKEHLNKVLSSMKFEKQDYQLGETYTKLIRKALKVEKIPEFEKVQHYWWINWFVPYINIIGIGIREDADMVEPQGEYKGWTHEAI